MPYPRSRRIVGKEDGIEVIVYDTTGGRRHLIVPEDGQNHERLLDKSVHDTGPVTYQGKILGCMVAAIVPAEKIEDRKLVVPHISLSPEAAGRFELERTERRRERRLVARVPGFSRQSFTAHAV